MRVYSHNQNMTDKSFSLSLAKKFWSREKQSAGLWIEAQNSFPLFGKNLQLQNCWLHDYL